MVTFTPLDMWLLIMSLLAVLSLFVMMVWAFIFLPRENERRVLEIIEGFSSSLCDAGARRKNLSPALAIFGATGSNSLSFVLGGNYFAKLFDATEAAVDITAWPGSTVSLSFRGET